MAARITAQWILLLLLLLLTTCSSSAESISKKVVVIPMPFTSHTKYHIQAGQALVRLGHRVWLTMPDFLMTKGVLNTDNFAVIEYSPSLGNMEDMTMEGFRDNYFKGVSDDWMLFINVMKDVCRELLSNNSFVQQVRDIGPDLILIDNIPMLKTMSVLAYKLGVPFAFLGIAYDPVTQRVPIAPAVNPVPLFQFSDRMLFFQRMANMLLFGISSAFDVVAETDAVARYAPEMPYMDLNALVALAEIWLVELDHILDYPKPSLPNVKFIGGTCTGSVQPLPEEFRTFMDGAQTGVVVVSFGSYVLHLPNALHLKVMQALQNLPFRSVFRSNLTSPDPAKIMTSPWLPQNDLLGHPTTKVFVSHCGNNGQYEALYNAVPIVCSPMFTDQWYNAERTRVKGFSETIDLNTVTVEELTTTILKVATDPSYKRNIQKASEMFKIEFGMPAERAAFWLDYVMKYGAAHMRSSGHIVPYYQFLGLDVLAVFALLLLVVIGSFVLILRWVCRKCINGKKKKAD